MIRRLVTGSWQTWSVAGMGICVFFVGLGLVVTKHHARLLFVELQHQYNQRDALDIEWTRLRLEKSLWTNHARVEQVAREQLNMSAPRAEHTFVIER